MRPVRNDLRTARSVTRTRRMEADRPDGHLAWRTARSVVDRV